MPERGALGIHLMVWGADWHAERFDLPRVLATCRALGFAGVEVPWLAAVPEAAAVRAARAAASEGLWVTVSTALPPRAALVDAGQAPRGVEWLRRAAEGAAALGSPILCGPMLAPVGDLPDGSARPWEAAAEGLAAAQGFAAGAGVRLCVEPLNRFETDTLNTLAQGASLCRQVGAGGAGPALLADTFHQNIEEADPLAAWREHLPWFGHVHLSENHRGPIGSGHIDWAAVLRVLDEGRYVGRMVVEGFNGRIRELARATCIWRALAEGPEAYAGRSAAYLLPRLGVATTAQAPLP